MLATLTKHLKTNPSLRWVWGMAIVFWGIAVLLTVHRYYTFYASYDQGIFNQVIWNSSHGRFFQSSLSSQLSTNVVHGGEVPNVAYHRLGQHFTPSLMLWVPLYKLFPSPVTLTVLMVTLVTAAGLVLYALARQHQLKPELACMIMASYYGANAILGPTLNNFHDICQIPLFVFTLLLGLERRWWWLYGPMALLIPWVREDSGIVLFSLGAYLTLSRGWQLWQARRRAQPWSRSHLLELWLGVGLCLYGFTYILVLTSQVMPLFSADVSKRFMLERFGQYATGDEASTLDIMAGMARNPLLLLGELVSPPGRTLAYLLGQWLPFAFVPAIAPAAWLAAGAPLVKLLIAKGFSVLAINIRYAMGIVPGLAYGTILWWKAHPQRFENPRFRRFWRACIGLSLVLTITANPNRTLSFLIPDSLSPWVYVSLPEQWQHAGHIRRILRQIPPDASVSTTTYLVPHLSSRREIVRFPNSLEVRTDGGSVQSVTYAAADLWQLQRYGVAFSSDRNVLQASVSLVDKVLADRSYGLQKWEDGVILLQKDQPSVPEALVQWQAFRQTAIGFVESPRVTLVHHPLPALADEISGLDSRVPDHQVMEDKTLEDKNLGVEVAS